MNHPYRTTTVNLQPKNRIGLRLLRNPTVSVVLTLGIPLMVLLILYSVGVVTRQTEVAGQDYLTWGATFGVTLVRGFSYTLVGIGIFIILGALGIGISNLFSFIQKTMIEASLDRMTQNEVDSLPLKEILRLQKVSSNLKLAEARSVKTNPSQPWI